MKLLLALIPSLLTSYAYAQPKLEAYSNSLLVDGSSVISSTTGNLYQANVFNAGQAYATAISYDANGKIHSFATIPGKYAPDSFTGAWSVGVGSLITGFKDNYAWNDYRNATVSRVTKLAIDVPLGGQVVIGKDNRFAIALNLLQNSGALESFVGSTGGKDLGLLISEFAKALTNKGVIDASTNGFSSAFQSATLEFAKDSLYEAAKELTKTTALSALLPQVAAIEVAFKFGGVINAALVLQDLKLAYARGDALVLSTQFLKSVERLDTRPQLIASTAYPSSNQIRSNGQPSVIDSRNSGAFAVPYAGGVSTTRYRAVNFENNTTGNAQFTSINAAGQSGATLRNNATSLETGSASVAGMNFYWGRWAENQGTQHTTTSGSTFNNVPVHYIYANVPYNGVSIPSTGQFSFNKFGGPAPTDFTGATGVLNSLSVNVDFGAQKFQVTNMNVSFGGRTLSLISPSATSFGLGAIPSEVSSGATRFISGALSGTCAGAGCGPTTNGSINGRFVGATANGIVAGYRASNFGGSATPINIGGVVGLTR